MERLICLNYQFTFLDNDFLLENTAVQNECLKLASFSAAVNLTLLMKLDQLFNVFSHEASQDTFQLIVANSYEKYLHVPLVHLGDQFNRILFPKRSQRSNPNSRANIFQSVFLVNRINSPA
jgi:hypothetical protein